LLLKGGFLRALEDGMPISIEGLGQARV